MAGVLPIALLLLAGCNRTRSVDVVATVNGHAIMRADMDRMVQAQVAQAQSQQQSPEGNDSLRLSVVGFDPRLLLQEIGEVLLDRHVVDVRHQLSVKMLTSAHGRLGNKSETARVELLG